MNIPLILSKVFPNREWFFDGNDFGDYNQLHMLDGLSKPTLEDIKNQENNVATIVSTEQTEKQIIVDTITTKLSSLSEIKVKINKLTIDEATKEFITDISELLYHHIKGTTNGS